MQRNIEGIRLIFAPADQETADLIAGTIVKALGLIQDRWGLEKPENCQIHVMTDWWGFFFGSVPWFWQPFLAIFFPLWGFRALRTWPYSAGWTQRYGRRVAIGIKPPRLLEVSDKRIGKLMFVEEKDTHSKVRHLACHELTHACSAYLKLPAWLNEGLAAVTVDQFLEKRTIRVDTLELVRNYLPKARPPDYRALLRLTEKAIAYHTVRGYWLVQYLEDQHPGFLKRLFVSFPAPGTIDREIAKELGMEQHSLWDSIDDTLVAHFEMKMANNDRG